MITVAATAIALLLLAGFVVVSRFLWTKSQFSLATLLLTVSVMAIPCGWFAREIQESRHQREALDWVIERGGYGHLSRVVISIGSMERRKPPRFLFSDFAEDHLSTWLGDDFFDDVTAISISKPDALERVNLLSQLKSIECRSPIEIDLSHLRGLNQLQTLEFDYCQIVGSRLMPIQELPALQNLSLIGINVSDSDLETLAQMKQLKQLGLGLTEVTDAGLEHIKGLDQLEWLNLGKTQVTDAGVEHLQKTLPDCKIER